MQLTVFLDTAGKPNIFRQQEERSSFQLIQHIYLYKKTPNFYFESRPSKDGPKTRPAVNWHLIIQG